LGNNNTVNATNAVAIGNATTVTGADGIAMGNGAQVAGADAIAIGTGASAGFSNSAAYGNGATATRANQQVFGTASNTYTMAGIGSAASKAAQSGSTELVTSDGAGNLATTSLASLGLASGADISAINSQLASLQTQIDDNQREARAGTALALASSNLHFDSRPGKLSVAAAYGNFQGESGLAAGLGYALSEQFRVNASFSGSPGANAYGVATGFSMTLN
jgi:autotransporter adhesin